MKFLRIKTIFVVVFAALFLSVFMSTSAFAATITLTTFIDEDDGVGGSGNGCSLFEAVQASNTDAAYGGCVAGSGADVISVPSGTYVMPLGNAFSNQITISSTVSIEGPSSGAQPVIDGTAKASPRFNVNAPNVAFKNLDLRKYDLLNWDVTFTNRDMLVENSKLVGVDVNTSCDGMIIRDTDFSNGTYIGVFGDDAVIENITAIQSSFLDIGTTNFANSGGDRATVRNVDFSNGSQMNMEKNGPGTTLFEDVRITGPNGDGLFMFSSDADDDGTTIIRRMSASNVVTDNAIFYDNANTTGRHQLIIEDSYFHNNASAFFARTTLETATPHTVIRNTVFEDNGTWDSAVYLDDGFVTIDRSSFINNSTTEPGNALFSSARLNLTNSVFYGNTTSASMPNYPGGALFYDSVRYAANSPSPQISRIINNTFANNTSNFGSAVYIADYNQTTSTRNTTYNPLLVNNLFHNNTGSVTCLAGGEPWYAGYLTFTAVFAAGSTNNMSSNDTGCGGATLNANLLLDSALSDTTTPQVGFQYEGGHTQMLKTQTGSPAIDTGTNTNCPVNDVTLNARPLGNTCDIGAFETLGVSTGGGGSPSTPAVVPGVPNTGAMGISHAMFATLIGGYVLIGAMITRIIRKQM